MSDKNLGMGVMISYLGGNEESVKAFSQSLNKTITEFIAGQGRRSTSFRVR
jgi:hypothetical protein